jgi:hypothetical protein
MEKNRTIPGIHRWFIPDTRPEFDIDPKHITIGEVFFIFFMQHWGEVVPPHIFPSNHYWPGGK